MSIKVKLCGFNDQESIEAAIQHNCDFLGFIFYDKSCRNISLNQANIFSKIINNQSKKVAVTVNCDIDIIRKICDNLYPDYFQFHGNESLDYLENFKKLFPDISIIKAFPINGLEDFNIMLKYNDIANYFLFDSKIDNKFGGSGIKINWDLFTEIKIDKNWFLSGGVNIANVEEAIQKTKAKMIDASSAIEIEKGVKSPRLIKDFLDKVKIGADIGSNKNNYKDVNKS